jgi:Tfp pilus assembly protein PilO
MKASIKRILSILTAMAMFICSLFIYASFVKPSYLEIKNLRAEVTSQSELVEKNQLFTSQVQKILDQYQNISEIEEKISLILPLKQNLPQSVNQIAGIAKINDLKIISIMSQQLAITPSAQPELVNGLGTIRFDVNLIGSYAGFKTFLQSLENNVNLMDLMDLKIETSGKLAAGNLSYVLGINTYYQTK